MPTVPCPLGWAGFSQTVSHVRTSHHEACFFLRPCAKTGLSCLRAVSQGVPGAGGYSSLICLPSTHPGTDRTSQPRGTDLVCLAPALSGHSFRNPKVRPVWGGHPPSDLRRAGDPPPRPGASSVHKQTELLPFPVALGKWPNHRGITEPLTVDRLLLLRLPSKGLTASTSTRAREDGAECRTAVRGPTVLCASCCRHQPVCGTSLGLNMPLLGTQMGFLPCVLCR